MTHLHAARFSVQTGLPDHVLKYLKFVEPVADKEDVFLIEQEVEKCKDVVFRRRAPLKTIIGIVPNVMLSGQDHALGFEHGAVDMKDSVGAPKVVRGQLVELVDDGPPFFDR